MSRFGWLLGCVTADRKSSISRICLNTASVEDEAARPEALPRRSHRLSPPPPPTLTFGDMTSRRGAPPQSRGVPGCEGRAATAPARGDAGADALATEGVLHVGRFVSGQCRGRGVRCLVWHRRRKEMGGGRKEGRERTYTPRHSSAIDTPPSNETRDSNVWGNGCASRAGLGAPAWTPFSRSNSFRRAS